MSQQLPWLARKLSQTEYDDRRKACTEQSVQDLTSHADFATWLVNKRLNVQTRRRQESERRAARTRTGFLLLLLALLAAAGLLRHRCPELVRLPLAARPHLAHLTERLQGISAAAQPVLHRASPRPHIAAASTQLQSLLQQLASKLTPRASAGIPRFPTLTSLVPSYRANPPAASCAGSDAASTITKPLDGLSACALASGHATGSFSGCDVSSSSSSDDDGALQWKVDAATDVKPGLLKRMCSRISKMTLLPKSRLPRVKLPSLPCPCKLIRMLRRFVRRFIPPIWPARPAPLLVPESFIADAADHAAATSSPASPSLLSEPGHVQQDATQLASDDASMSNLHALDLGQSPSEASETDSLATGTLLQRMNRSSTSLAVYIAKMPMRIAKVPMRTARTWKLFSEGLTQQGLGTAPAARMNRSSTSLAVYIAQMPVRTAKSWGAFTKQSFLALPAAKHFALRGSSPRKAELEQATSAEESSQAEGGPSLVKHIDDALDIPAEVSQEAHAGAGCAESDQSSGRSQKHGAIVEAGLFRRFNRSSKPLAELISRIPSEASQRISALTRQTLMALPASTAVAVTPRAPPHAPTTDDASTRAAATSNNAAGQNLHAAQPMALDSTAMLNRLGRNSSIDAAAGAVGGDEGELCEQPEVQHDKAAESRHEAVKPLVNAGQLSEKDKRATICLIILLSMWVAVLAAYTYWRIKEDQRKRMASANALSTTPATTENGARTRSCTTPLEATRAIVRPRAGASVCADAFYSSTAPPCANILTAPGPCIDAEQSFGASVQTHCGSDTADAAAPSSPRDATSAVADNKEMAAVVATSVALDEACMGSLGSETSKSEEPNRDDATSADDEDLAIPTEDGSEGSADVAESDASQSQAMEEGSATGQGPSASAAASTAAAAEQSQAPHGIADEAAKIHALDEECSYEPESGSDDSEADDFVFV